MKVRILANKVSTSGRVLSRGDTYEGKDRDLAPLVACGAAEKWSEGQGPLPERKPEPEVVPFDASCVHPPEKRHATPRMGAPHAWRCECGHEGGTR